MNNIYRDNFEQVKAAYPSVFKALAKCCKKLYIDFYLIGAQSRNVWVSHLDLKIRTTSDIDYCIYIPDRTTWNSLNRLLIETEGFCRDKKLPYRFYKDGEMIDLIPFGGMEENGEVVLHNPTMELSVIGCKEVTEEAVIVEGDFKVVTLVGSCIMKLAAYYENPGLRSKDFDDYMFLVENYDEIAGAELFSGKYDDLIEADFEVKTACARMLGRHMSTILSKNVKLKETSLAVLYGKLKNFDANEIDQMYKVADKNDKIILKLKLISETIRGITETEEINKDLQEP